MYGIDVYVMIFLPIIVYYIRMAFRSIHLGGMRAKNWLDIVNLLNWIINLVFWIFPAVMFPFYYLSDQALPDFMHAWYTVNFISDWAFFYFVIKFVVNLVLAIGSGRGDQYICIDATDPTNCYFNDVFISRLDAWWNFGIWMILDGVMYFLLFWFGADAMRVL